MRTELISTLRRIDEWMCDALDHIDPLRGSDPAETLFRCKNFNELAAYIAWRERFGHGDDPCVSEMRRHLLAHMTRDYVDFASKDAARILVFCSALSYALRHGVLKDETAERARRALSPSFAWSTEMLPCRLLDMALACRDAGVIVPLSPAAVVSVSSAALPPCPLQTGRAGYYSFTHTVFYAHALDVLELADGGALAQAIEGGICRALHRQDYDLAYELFACAPLCGMPFTPAQASLLEVSLPLLNRDGSLRPDVHDEAVAAFVPLCPSETDWAERAHVTQVAAMGIAAAVRFRQDEEFSAAADGLSATLMLGEALEALHRRRWMAGLAACERLAAQTPSAAHPISRDLFRLLRSFVHAAGRGSELSEALVEERKVYAGMRSGGDFDREVLPHVHARYASAKSALDRAFDPT